MPGAYVTKPALELILHAAKHRDVPHFLILDEMNLSHVERYFADLLSATESNEGIPLYEGDARTSGGQEIPCKLKLPENLFIIGTVNVDETTYLFSPIRRAGPVLKSALQRSGGNLLKGEARNVGPLAGVFDGDAQDAAVAVHVQQCVLVQVARFGHGVGLELDVQRVGILKISHFHMITDETCPHGVLSLEIARVRVSS